MIIFVKTGYLESGKDSCYDSGVRENVIFKEVLEMKKTIIVFLAVLVALSAVMALTGCSSKDDEGGTISADDVSGGGSAAISEDQAVEIALADAGVSRGDAYELQVEDADDSYNVVFRDMEYLYDYYISKENGSIVDQDAAPLAQAEDVEGGSVSSQEALSIALSDAGFEQDQVTITDAKLNNENGIPAYEIEFNDGEREFEYTIDAATGEILGREMEPLDR